MKYDKIIIGAGLYGLYSALYCGKKGQQVLVLECEKAPFTRATYINQARVHMGYHYPRSIYTAQKSAKYFNRFNKDYGFCINSEFNQIYATSKDFSWTGANEFKKFCNSIGIRCDEVPVTDYFNEGVCDGAFITTEYTYDAMLLKKYFVEEISKYKNIEIKYGETINSISRDEKEFEISTQTGSYRSDFVLNATYASTNQINKMAGFDSFEIKYELCEIILCKASGKLSNAGITVMDGPFFSIMPFGKTGYHSLTSVTRTPHEACFSELPKFACQDGKYCNEKRLGNCDLCVNKPKTSWNYMNSMASKYLREDFSFEYVESRYSMKPILRASEIDDSRPTLIKVMSDKPKFISVLSGKINTVYDLDEFLD